MESRKMLMQFMKILFRSVDMPEESKKNTQKTLLLIFDRHAVEAKAEQRHECEAMVARKLMRLKLDISADTHNSIAAACHNGENK